MNSSTHSTPHIDIGDEIYYGLADCMVVIEDIADGFFRIQGNWIAEEQFEAFAPADENLINIGVDEPDLTTEKRESQSVPLYPEQVLEAHRFCSGSLAAIRFKEKQRKLEWGRLR